MHKQIKRIIAMTLAISAFCAITPAKYLKAQFSKVAYASSDDDDDDDDEDKGYLEDLDISEGSISFSEKKMEYTTKIDNSIDEVTITVKAEDSTDKIKIDGSDVDLDNSRKAQKTIELERGRNLIKIKVDSEAYGIRTYNLVINRGSASSNSSNSDDENDAYLDDISLSDGDISFSKETMKYDVNVSSSVDEIRITAQPEYDDDDVKIDDVSVDKDEDYRRSVKLAYGGNTILIEVQDEDGNEQTYTLNINRGGTIAIDSSQVIDTTQDPIYLDDIVIEDGDIPLKFKPKVTSYAVDVDDDQDNIIIKAKPEYDDVVRINGTKVEDLYSSRVNLEEGKNVIEIKINNSNTYDKSDDEYEERTYTVTVYRGTSQGTAATSNGGDSETNTNSSKANQWVSVNGKWQYNDALGNPLKNIWYYDRNYDKNYYLQADGYMATGWLYNSGAWYYLDESGTMQIGWKQVGSNWYYLDNTGKMTIGWFKDMDGKYYYLNSSGAMVTNTTIDGYKIGSNGAWVK